MGLRFIMAALEEQRLRTEMGVQATLMEKRIIFLSHPIDNVVAEKITTLLLYFDSMGHEPIKLLINSPGGSISAGFAIIDCMRGIESPVHTYAFGMAASMAALILSSGEKGKRFASPNAEVLIHQPLASNLFGQASDIEIAARSIIRTKEKICTELARNTGKTAEEIEAAIDRDNCLNAQEAVEFGIIDSIDASWTGA